MPAIRTCPEPTTLERFLLNLLDQPESAQIEEHLSHCDACLTRVESACGHDTIAQSLRGQGTPADQSDEPVVRDLIARVRQLRATPGRETDSDDTPAHAPLGDPLSVLAPAQG